MIKIAHECPVSIFDDVQRRTHYDYALVHLFEENRDYYNKFYRARNKLCREIILDNSIFELGNSVSSDLLRKWIGMLKPSWYIVPDVLEDAIGTVDNLVGFAQDGLPKESKPIGVLQGKSYKELCRVYRVMEPVVDMIAISFDYSLYEEWFPNEKTKYHSWMKGRTKLIRSMLRDGVINVNKPHHLLGCGLPQEFRAYQDMDFIYSLDTSNPVVHGIKDIWYDYNGLEDKESVKLYTMMNEDVSMHMPAIRYNIDNFSRMTNG